MKISFDGAALRRAVQRHRLPAAITAIVGIAVILTLINVSLYYSGGTSFIDLSRPGLERERQQVQVSPASQQEAFAGTGTLDIAALDTFQRLYDNRRANLRALGTYSDEALSDASLRFSNGSGPDTSE